MDAAGGAGAGAGNGADAGAGNGAGTQFITGACTADADCGSGCCGFNTGKCAGAVVAQERDGGCGFGDAQPNDNAAQALTGGNGNAQGAAAGNGNANGDAAANGADVQAQDQGAGNANQTQDATGATGGDAAASGAGTQFITGACTSDADCADGCCGFNTGKCAGPVVAQERDGGCGFGDAQPNDNAAQALQRRSLGRNGPAMM